MICTSLQKHILTFIFCLSLIPIARVARSQSIADITERTEKSVVRINVTTNDGEGIGSGFVIDPVGVIVTNCHVMAGATKATVVFADQKSYPVDGTYLIDQARDIAVIRINGNGLQPMKLAAQSPRKGEEVLALGAPLGFDFTVTRGIVSAHRTASQLKEMGMDDLAGSWVQVDVAISPGNSGGPIVNLQGEVVAMSTMVINNAQNLNFGISAIDITDALAKARTQPLKKLSESAANVAMSSGKSVGGKEMPKVPASAISDYVNNGRKEFTKLVSALKREISEESLLLRDIKAGEIGLDFAQDGRALEAVIVHRSNNDRGKWYFRSDRIKNSMVEKQQARVKSMGDTYSQAKGGLTDESLVAVLGNAGPKLDTRMAKTVGFIRDATVLEVIDKVVLMLYEGKPYFAALDSSAGLYPGDKILPAPFFVAGTLSFPTTEGVATFTLLQQVTMDQLRSSVGVEKAPASSASGSEPKGEPTPAPLAKSDEFDNMFSTPADGSRVWTSKNGHQIKAILLSKTATHVKLKRSDNGSVIEVPLSQLSEADRSYLKQ